MHGFGQITHPQYPAKRKRLLITGILHIHILKTTAIKKLFAIYLYSEEEKINNIARARYQRPCHVQKKAAGNCTIFVQPCHTICAIFMFM